MERAPETARKSIGRFTLSMVQPGSSSAPEETEGGGVHVCEVCGACFETKRGLSSHCRSHLRQLRVAVSDSSGAPIDLLYQLIRQRDGKLPFSSGQAAMDKLPEHKTPKKLKTPKTFKILASPPTPKTPKISQTPKKDSATKLKIKISTLVKKKYSKSSTASLTPLPPASSPPQSPGSAPPQLSPPKLSKPHTVLAEPKKVPVPLSPPLPVTSKPLWAPQDTDAPLNLTAMTAHTLRDDVHVCELCGAWYETRKGLSSHVRAHLRQFGVEMDAKGAPIDVLHELLQRDKQLGGSSPPHLDDFGDCSPSSTAPKCPTPSISPAEVLHTNPTTPPPHKRLKPSPAGVESAVQQKGDSVKDVSCEFCHEKFKKSQSLASHARCHLRQLGVTEWTVHGSPMATLRELMARRGATSLPKPHTPAKHSGTPSNSHYFPSKSHVLPTAPLTKPLSLPTALLTTSTKPHTPPAKSHSSPTMPHTPPAKSRSSPTMPHTPPAKSRSPPTMPHTPPAKSRSPPIMPHTPPTKHHTPPTSPHTPPAKPLLSTSLPPRSLAPLPLTSGPSPVLPAPTPLRVPKARKGTRTVVSKPKDEPVEISVTEPKPKNTPAHSLSSSRQISTVEVDIPGLVRCEFCSEVFDSRKGLSCHARAHLRQLGVRWSPNASPIDTLYQLMLREGTLLGSEIRPEAWRKASLQTFTPSSVHKTDSLDSAPTGSEATCDLCGFDFENRKALASHARAHLRQQGVDWHTNGSPIETLAEWMQREPGKVAELHKRYMRGDLPQVVKKRSSSSPHPSLSEPESARPAPVREVKGHSSTSSAHRKPSASLHTPAHTSARGCERRPPKHLSESRLGAGPRKPRVGNAPSLMPHPPKSSLVKLVGKVYSLKCRFCEEVFRGPLSVQEDWLIHLRQHILNLKRESALNPDPTPDSPAPTLPHADTAQLIGTQTV